MEKYDDFLIMSPEKMEQIAKEYKKTLSKKINPQKDKKEYDLQNSLSYKNLRKNIFNLQNTLHNLRQVCSSRFYNQKKDIISNILQKIQTMPKIDCQESKPKNYCNAIDACINVASTAIEDCVKIITEFDFTAPIEIIEIMQTLTLILPMLSSLFGVCRFRN